MSETILCAIDDQEHSAWAADAAIGFARATSSLLIFFMANPLVMPSRGPIFYWWTREYINTFFDQARTRARRAGVYGIHCITKETADVARSILVEAVANGVSYIVIGSDFRPGMFSGWTHSISREVIAGAHCPTIVVHRNMWNRNTEPLESLAAE